MLDRLLPKLKATDHRVSFCCNVYGFRYLISSFLERLKIVYVHLVLVLVLVLVKYFVKYFVIAVGNMQHEAFAAAFLNLLHLW